MAGRYKYGKVEVVDGVLRGPVVRSCGGHERLPMYERILAHRQHELLAVKLKGFLFFGAVLQVEALTTQLLQEAELPEPPSWLLLDFSLVDGLDATCAQVRNGGAEEGEKG